MPSQHDPNERGSQTPTLLPPTISVETAEIIGTLTRDLTTRLETFVHNEMVDVAAKLAEMTTRLERVEEFSRPPCPPRPPLLRLQSSPRPETPPPRPPPGYMRVAPSPTLSASSGTTFPAPNKSGSFSLRRTPYRQRFRPPPLLVGLALLSGHGSRSCSQPPAVLQDRRTFDGDSRGLDRFIRRVADIVRSNPEKAWDFAVKFETFCTVT
ncbi:unnamed protein product [Tilletia caries]|uniref:Uncharacterized protein n=1 Tax=Tilletia caries TaxID=13290 RepID=A0A177U569_9BASI|nr:hypothetical protein CF335_g3292 [Tilletia laevis]KAE8261281.1 hypothetical protein A4X03_0g3392 [Tilletia caries]CAD6906398.1 unnamed protein product [Tilletia caries]CAD6951385.1 unnamed protein product [Tilletia caries]